MKKSIIISFFVFGIFFKALGCSPIAIPISDFIETYQKGKEFYVVEGYYIENGNFYVTEASNSSININKEYEVFEYGPFGNSCEMYEMRTRSRESEAIPRILLVYKNRSVNNKLVTPIFLEEGVRINGNRAEFTMVENNSKVLCYTSLEKLKKRLFKGKKVQLQWNKEKKDD